MPAFQRPSKKGGKGENRSPFANRTMLALPGCFHRKEACAFRAAGISRTIILARLADFVMDPDGLNFRSSLEPRGQMPNRSGCQIGDLDQYRRQRGIKTLASPRAPAADFTVSAWVSKIMLKLAAGSPAHLLMDSGDSLWNHCGYPLAEPSSGGM